MDSQTGIAPGTYTFPVYSSLNPPSSGYLSTINWHGVNYVINHKGIGNNNMEAIQAAIWHFDGGVPTNTHQYDSWFTGADYNALITAAAANPSYVPSVGEKYAVALYIVNSQPLMIEIPIPNVPVPEFPVLAIPAIFLIAVIYVIVSIKSRKKE